MLDRAGGIGNRSALLGSWRLLLIFLVWAGCSRAPSDPPFHRFVEDVVPGDRWHETKVRILHETRNVLFAPYRSGLKEIEVGQDGTITLGALADVGKVGPDAAGIRIQVQQLPAAPGRAADDAATHVYVPLPPAGDAPDLAGTRVQVLPAGEAGRKVRASAREVVGLPREHVTKAVRIPRSARLNFGFGLEGQEGSVPQSGARFTVEVQHGQERKTIFSQTIEREPNGDQLGWVDATVDLSDLAGSTVRFVFRTENVESNEGNRGKHVVQLFDWSPVWSSPILHGPEPQKNDDRPNIILISLDTLRADHLGCYGYHRNTSPNIDKFVAEGVLFERAIAPSSWTVPSHASVFTGLHPSVHQAGLFTLGPSQRLREVEITLAELARSHGYLTAAYTEGCHVRAALGFSQGFELYSDGDVSNFPAGHVEKTFTNALQWLETDRTSPFLLFVHTYQPHVPYWPPKRFAKMFSNGYSGNRSWNPQLAVSETDRVHSEALYDGEIAYTDEVVGNFFAKLRSMGLMESTVIILFSDHGEEFWEHGGYEHAKTLYDEVLHVPLFIRLVGDDPPSGRIGRQVSLTDVYPTVVEILDIEQTLPPDCISLLPLVENPAAQGRYDRNAVFSELTAHDKETDDRGSTKRILWRMESVTTEREKYIECREKDTVELYRLDVDPEEKNDTASQSEDRLGHYRVLLESYLARVAAGRSKSSRSDQAVPVLSEEERRQLKALGYI